ncbi:hypothetical protein RTO_04230 [[Ruminococcus] torques L2-14]|uniref:UDP-N-acetylglucosamine kinase n=1 Tax=[Ruminococcus] torques L2-14 TaxID=657313 RepID=D4M1S8_9FIRM|nr:ATP-binding protein [[Ruminococcus] torques]CBL25190.1 hypothetical protein RTO_04230 [[Ruminococcus] torques L2-14]
MQKLTFVIGANAAGKTYFIEHYLANEKAVVLDVYDYQQKVYDEHDNKELITFEEQFRCLKKANEKHLHDIINELKQGNNVIAEQTFFKAKRRIAYIDEIRNEMDVKIEVYVMHPSNERWIENSKKREDIKNIEVYENQKKQMEFPNPAEGFDAIFEVIDDEIILRMDDIKPEIVKQARQELTEEDTRIRREDEREHKHRQLIESMNTRPFWHYCEVCGKKSSLLQRRLWMRDGTTRHILEDLGYWGQEPVGIVH